VPVAISVVINVLGRHDVLARVLDGLERQSDASEFEVIVAPDAAEPAPDGVESAVAGRARLVQSQRAGASAARNAGWRAAHAPLVLFLGADILPAPRLVAEHLAWHAEHSEDNVAVLGDVRWARGLRVTPFMRWLDRGWQFDYHGIAGVEAGWGRFYTANVAVKRTLLERVGGFDEEAFPFHDEDLDIAPAERRFVARWPDVPPFYRDTFARALAEPPARGRGVALARFVPKWVPVVGPRVQRSFDMYFRQAIAPAYLASWEAAERDSE
jgi:glycosyltransferase involved in cell wall biosynthesis